MVEPKDAYVIVVEDDPSTLLLEMEFLREAGLGRCEGRATGWQAMDLARSGQKVDLILLDIGLAYEDGCDVVKKIKADSELNEVLVVAVTAHTEPDDLRRAREAGCDGFIGKPLSRTRFPDQIRRILRGENVWEMR
jgi:two-component system cell cycle response regulator DivK